MFDSRNEARLAAPSPKNATPTHDAAAAELVRRIEQMHVAALAASEAGLLAEHLGGHLLQRHTFVDRKMVRPMRTDHRFVLGEMRTCSAFV